MSATLDNKNSWQTGNTINYLFLYRLKAIFNCQISESNDPRYFGGSLLSGGRYFRMAKTCTPHGQCERNTLEKKVMYIL